MPLVDIVRNLPDYFKRQCRIKFLSHHVLIDRPHNRQVAGPQLGLLLAHQSVDRSPQVRQRVLHVAQRRRWR